MTVVTLAAAAATLCALLLLAWRDPGRLKAARSGNPDTATDAGLRRRRLVLGLLAVAPGLGLAASGAWAEFTMWFGLLPISGWLTARALSGAR